MNMFSKICLFTLLNVLMVVSTPCGTAANDSPASSVKDSAQVTVSSKNLPDGLYLVLRQADEEKKLDVVSNSECLLVNDFHFLLPAEREKPRYLVLSTNEFIPFALATKPAMADDDRGNPKIMLQLSKEQIVPLEEFTRKNLSKTVAVVVGGQIVSAHKVKEPLTGGKFQISWCTGNACRVLMSKLKGDSK